jgi:hypothetical protein
MRQTVSRKAPIFYWYASVNTSVNNSGGKILLRRGMYFTGLEGGLGKTVRGTAALGPKGLAKYGYPPQGHPTLIY